MASRFMSVSVVQKGHPFDDAQIGSIAAISPSASCRRGGSAEPVYPVVVKIGAALWSVTIANVSNGDRREDRDDGGQTVGTGVRASAAFSRAWGSRYVAS